MAENDFVSGWRIVVVSVALVVAGPANTAAAQAPPAAHVVTPHASSSFTAYAHPSGTYSLEHPEDWKVHEGTGRVTIGADDGLVAVERGFRTVYGAIVATLNDPETSNPARTIETSARAIVDSVLKRNAHQSLSVPVHTDRPLGGAPAASAVLIGLSPVTGRGERAEIVVRAFGPTQVLYIILVSPTEAHARLEAPLRRLRDSLQVTGVR